MKFWYHKRYVDGKTDWWTMSKPRRVRDEALRLGLAKEVKVSGPMRKEDVLRFHTGGYLKELKNNGSLLSPEIGFEWSTEAYECGRYRSQGQLEAARHAIASGEPAFNMASGFHHAEPDKAMGYCTLNGIVLAHRCLEEEFPGIRTAVLDVDAHYGNGCATYAAMDQDFVHLDNSLRNSSDFGSYMDRLRLNLEKALYFKPDLIEYNAGMDVLAGDRVGGGFLTLDQARIRDGLVYGFSATHDIPIVTCLAGGYQDDAIRGHLNTFKAALKAYCDE